MKFSLNLFVALVLASCVAYAQEEEKEKEEEEKPKGLIINKPGAFEGYNLFTPLDSGTTYLMDNEGRVVHTWESDYRPGSNSYLLENGNLLRPAGYGRKGNGVFHGGGAGYRVEEYAWDGSLVWEFIYASDQHLMHHDVEPMPNGNLLILAWEMKTKEEAMAAGRDPELLGADALWPEHIIEVKPIRPEGGEIVWEWHLWDHLIQDFDETMANFGDVGAHPELMEVNPTGHWQDRIPPEERERLEALGYLEGAPDGDAGEGDSDDDGPPRGSTGSDWHHANAIDYSAKLDQIAISSRANHEIWVLDHSTTTEEARGHTGGRAGKGGDFLYRWGNPLSYRAGFEEDQRLFGQHDINWIGEGLPGAGNLLVFNNGSERPDGGYSTVEELVAPLNADGTYAMQEGASFGPVEPVWMYAAPDNKEDFYSSFISGVRRLANGNTLICEGASGTFFEVTPDGEMAWRYVNPAFPPPRPKKEGEDEDKSRKLNNAVFRIYRYAPDYSGLQGKDLSPGPLLTEYLKTHPASTARELDDDQ